MGTRDTWLARRAPRCGFQFRLSGTGGTLRRWVRKGVSKWHVPKEAFDLAFGTCIALRRFPKDVPTELRRGHPAGLRDGSEGFIGRVLREYVSFSERLFRGGTSRRGLLGGC